MSSRVYLIGAGPGDPGLLTLRGADRLARADVVLFDGLSNDRLLDHATGARHICVGKHGQSRIWRQDEIIAEMLTHARAGRTVVRLKGGDPAVFARTSEEVDALVEAGIDFEIVPGITAALAAGSFAGIPITHRGLASAVALVAGHEDAGKPESSLDWAALARFPGTLVIYMGVTKAARWTAALIDHGKDPATPTAIIRRCSLPDQNVIQCRLDEVAGHLTPASRFRPPVITIVGPVATLGPTMDWYSKRPLHRQTVWVTRPRQRADDLVDRLEEAGANVIVRPAIRIDPPADWASVDTAIERLLEFDWLVFSSRNGVDYFLDRLFKTGQDARSLSGLKIACVGSKTGAALARFGLRADRVPANFSGESLAAEFGDSARGKKFLLIRASRGRETIRDALAALGGDVDSVVAYQHRDETDFGDEIRAALANSSIDWLTITSGETARSLHRGLGSNLAHALQNGVRIATLSPITSAAVRDLGLKVHAQAEQATMQSLVEAIIAGSKP